MSHRACPACGASGLEVFHEQDGVPAHSCLLLASREEALGYPRGAMRLALCAACGFVTNTAFDPAVAEMSARYESSQGFSPRFRTFAASLATRWIERYGLAGHGVVEIGCGGGEFIELMCELGVGHGVGVDPVVDPAGHENDSSSRIRWVADRYGAEHLPRDAKAVVCRHTLEHIQDVAGFLRTLAASCAGRSDIVALFEVPDTLRVLRDLAFWDLYYEHCSYFGIGSLVRAFRRAGFDVVDVTREYDDQYLVIEARPGRGGNDVPPPWDDDRDAIREAVASFGRRYGQTIEALRTRFQDLRSRGTRVALWGAGSKATAYLDALGLTNEVVCVVDVNPFKQGMYVAGSGHPIVAPGDLRAHRPDLVIAMNSIYLDEIQRDMTSLGVEATLQGV